MNNDPMRQKKSLKITWPLRKAERRRKIGEFHEAESDDDTSTTQFFPEEPKTTRDCDQDQYMFWFTTQAPSEPVQQTMIMERLLH